MSKICSPNEALVSATKPSDSGVSSLGLGTLRRLKQRHRGYGDTFYIDEVFVKINGKQQYLWRAVDQDGEVVDVYLQARRDGAAAKRFFKRLMQELWWRAQEHRDGQIEKLQCGPSRTDA